MEGDRTDVAELQQPMQIGTRGVQMILKCMQNGTEEMKNLLLSECDVIFECKVCRSLFRGLPNLLCHKRSYCIEQYVEDRKDFPQATASDTCYVEPTEPDPEYADPQDEVTAAEVRARRGRFREYRDPILSCLAQKNTNPEEPPEGPVPVTHITETLPCNIKYPAGVTVTPGRLMVQLSPLRGLSASSTVKTSLTSSAVGSMSSAVQSLTKRLGSYEPSKEYGTSMSPDTAVASVCLTKSPDGDCSEPGSPNSQEEILKTMKGVDIKKKKCLQCSKSFLHLQYLLSHMKTKHSEERKLYKCLYCDTVFQYTRSIGRHLLRRHLKRPKDIQPLLRKIREESITVKSVAESAKKASTKSQINGNGGQAEQKKKKVMFKTNFSLIQCHKCGKVFGKKSSRDAHEKAAHSGDSLMAGQRKRGRPKKFLVKFKDQGNNNTTGRLGKDKAKLKKAGRPCKIIQKTTVLQVKREPDNNVENDKALGDTLGQKGGRGPRSRPSLDRQHSNGSVSKNRALTPSGATAKAAKPHIKVEPMELMKGEQSPSKVKSTGYQETFEEIAKPYIDTNELKCLVCKQFFQMKAYLVTHVCSKHLQLKRFKCNFCDFKGLFKSDVIYHVRSQHKDQIGGAKGKEKLLQYVESL